MLLSVEAYLTPSTSTSEEPPERVMLNVAPFSFAETGTDRVVPALICVSFSLGENFPSSALILIPSNSPSARSNVGRSTLLDAVKSQLLPSDCSASCTTVSCADTSADIPAADTVPAIMLTVMAAERRPAKNALFIFASLLFKNFNVRFHCNNTAM